MRAGNDECVRAVDPARFFQFGCRGGTKREQRRQHLSFQLPNQRLTTNPHAFGVRGAVEAHAQRVAAAADVVRQSVVAVAGGLRDGGAG